jgi:hypothetical protein
MVVSKNSWGDICWPNVESQLFKRQAGIYQIRVVDNRVQMYYLQTSLIFKNGTRLVAVRKTTYYREQHHNIVVPKVIIKIVFIQFYKFSRRIVLENPFNFEYGCNMKSYEKIYIFQDFFTVIEQSKRIITKFVLDPEWEEIAEDNQIHNNIRPGYVITDMIERIQERFLSPIYLINLEICGIRIGNRYFPFLRKLNTTPQIYRQIKFWVKKGFRIKQQQFVSKTIFYFILRIFDFVLFDLKLVLGEKLNKKTIYIVCPPLWYQLKLKTATRLVFRFLPNVLFVSPYPKFTTWIEKIISQWTCKLGFNLKGKREIKHTRNKFLDINGGISFPGLEIFGFCFQHYAMSQKITNLKFHATTILYSILQTRNFRYTFQILYKIIILPSKKRVKKHCDKLSLLIFTEKDNVRQQILIKKVNFIIHIWCAYFRYYNCRCRFHIRDYTIFQILKQWSIRKVKMKSSIGERFRKYFRKILGTVRWRTWTFRTLLDFLKYEDSHRLLSYIDFNAKFFTPVQKNISVFNVGRILWSKRTFRANYTSNIVVGLWERQDGICHFCKLDFSHHSCIQMQSKIFKNMDKNINYQYDKIKLVHQFCYKKKIMIIYLY